VLQPTLLSIWCTFPNLWAKLSYYVTKEKLLDERLLSARNNIAHGRSISVDVNDFIELHEQILGMMEDFRSQIDNSAVLRKFRRI
jgi:MAE_28990/MAE_18760-like HEPN